MSKRVKVAIIGSGNIGTDLLIKVMRKSKILEVAAFVGIDPLSEGLQRAKGWGFPTTSEGVEGLIRMSDFEAVNIVFDATSAKAHIDNWRILSKFSHISMIDMTPAAIGPYVVPPVNFDQLSTEQNINMVTCGGQATIPIVAAVSRVTKVKYAEIIATISSASAGPGTRQNIDEFTVTTARAIEKVANVEKAKAIIILNPAEPPIIMRDTIFTLSQDADRSQIEKSINDMVSEVQRYVPGYRLKQRVQFEEILPEKPVRIDGLGFCHGLKTSVFVEVEGAGHYLPPYAGNLDIMTSAALAVGERLARASLLL